MSWPARSNKYGNERTEGFSSKLEAAVYQILQLRQTAGQIKDLKTQQKVDLSCQIYWNVDFSFIEIETGEKVWAEAKGMETERYSNCKKLWKGGHGPGKLEIWKGSWQRPTLVEVIIP